MPQTNNGANLEFESQLWAAAVIFAHNHSSGDPKPSETDAKTHRQLTEAGKILGLRILDHIIVAKKKYFSFQEAGLVG